MTDRDYHYLGFHRAFATSVPANRTRSLFWTLGPVGYNMGRTRSNILYINELASNIQVQIIVYQVEKMHE